MSTPTNEEIESAIATSIEKGVQSAASDGQSATAISLKERQDALDRKKASESVVAGDLWGNIGRRRAMPNWNE